MAEIVQIIQPSGKLDISKLMLLNNEIESVLARGTTLILIDFQDVTNIEQDSIEVLKNILKDIHNYQEKLYICSLNEQVKTTFELTNTNYLFKPLSNRQEFEEIILANK